jgi:hypothetical protein
MASIRRKEKLFQNIAFYKRFFALSFLKTNFPRLPLEVLPRMAA